MVRDINKLIEQTLRNNVVKATRDGKTVWVCLDKSPKSAVELAVSPKPIGRETFELFRSKR